MISVAYSAGLPAPSPVGEGGTLAVTDEVLK